MFRMKAAVSHQNSSSVGAPQELPGPIEIQIQISQPDDQFEICLKGFPICPDTDGHSAHMHTRVKEDWLTLHDWESQTDVLEIAGRLRFQKPCVRVAFLLRREPLRFISFVHSMTTL